MANRRLRVGIGIRNYGYTRVSYGLPVPDVEYRKPLYLPWRYLRRGDPRLENTYLFAPVPRVDLYHLWNGVSLGRRPWVTSHEAHLPRHPGHPPGWWHELSMRRLRSNSCRRILPFSEYSRRFFLWQHRDQLDAEITSKLHLFRGALPIDDARCRLHEQFLERQPEGLTLIYIGHDYFQKGGVSVLRAFLRLKDRLPGLRLRVISRLKTGDFVTQSTPADADREKQFLRSDQRIEWDEALPNADVMDRIVTSHVGVLATLDDQQPWSPLECMSVGVPMIATAITALPEEVTEGSTGWLLPLPTQENLRWTGLQAPQGSDERRRLVADAQEELTQHLVDRISVLYDNKKVLQSMSQSCIAHVRSNHDPATQALALRRIYEEALA